MNKISRDLIDQLSFFKVVDMGRYITTFMVLHPFVNIPDKPVLRRESEKLSLCYPVCSAWRDVFVEPTGNQLPA